MKPGDKAILAGAGILGVLATLAYYKSKSAYASSGTPVPKSVFGGPTPTPAGPAYRAPPAATPKAAPVPASQGGDAPDVPTADPSSMVASFGDTPALPPGTVYDAPPGG